MLEGSPYEAHESKLLEIEEGPPLLYEVGSEQAPKVDL